MAEKINASGKLDRKEYARLSIYIYYRQPIAIVVTLIGLMVLFFIFLTTQMNFSSDANYTTIGLGLLYAIYILGRPYLIYKNAYQYFVTSKHLQEEMHYEFDEDRIVVRGENFLTEHGWDKFYKIIELKSFFLMYHDARLMNIIPKSFFKHPADINRLRQLIAAKSHIRQQLRKS